jgi:DNA-binding HxlR family transcriptional regulator
MRARLKGLADAGVIAAPRNGDVARGSFEYQLTAAGEDLLVVTDILERWLAESPDASRPFGGAGAKAAIGALVEGWSAAVLRALAAKPFSIADLDSLIRDFNYPALERRIAAMRLAGQVEAIAAGGRETPYAVTAWLRRGVAPLLAAIHWEAMHIGDGAPMAGIDAEAVFLLIMPLLKLEGNLLGTCRLAVELPNGREQRLAGALVGVQNGAVVGCTSRISGSADAWASGSVGAWLQALVEGDITSLELGGNGRLVRALVGGFHRVLFSATPQRGSRVQVPG